MKREHTASDTETKSVNFAGPQSVVVFLFCLEMRESTGRIGTTAALGRVSQGLTRHISLDLAVMLQESARQWNPSGGFWQVGKGVELI